MTKLNDFFRPSAEPLSHPRLRDWKRRLDAGGRAELELFRPRTALGIAQTDMNLHFTENGKGQSLETVTWDDDLNTGLVALGVRAVNPDQEAERFALGLRAAFRGAEREFGDGYFNAALFEFLKERELDNYPEIGEVLVHAVASRPHREGRGYTLCRQMIDDAISGRAHELTDRLRYTQGEAEQILVTALARYLDERFSVSRRRQLGLL